MSKFTGPLRLEHLDADWKRWKLLEPLVWEIDTLGSGKEIVVEAGFIFDGATTPRLIWAVLPPTGAYMRAAGLHDRCLEWLKAGTPNPYAPTRRKADRQFLLAMKACGVSFLVRWAMYLGVRAYAIWRGR
ncbi:MAG: hypothetical protein A3E78_11690 [Alphaproteobacteria bacterium RIFCSPHIGHO2_12_FULL_63_12]|nr:MAG: hypothetical protein A3E78_11690 [Alphaproteobacteria bacterium RIFCSPHIGHO2_12_FULL_63_12]